MKKNISNNNNGFTLVEMLVSLAIFVVVTTIVGGTYIMFVQKQRDQLGMQNVQQDVQNFFDTLEREVRTGYGDTFPSASTTPYNSLTFTNQKNDGTLTTYSQNSSTHRIERNNTAITSDRTYIQDLKFLVPSKSEKTTTNGFSYLSGMPTRVTVLVKACVDKVGNNCISAQTSLAVRQLKPKP